MDTTTQVRLLDRLDAIWAAQIQQGEVFRRHGEMLREILQHLAARPAPASSPPSPSPAPSSPSFWQLAAENGRYWLAGIALLIWVLRGNDLGAVAQHLFK